MSMTWFTAIYICQRVIYLKLKLELKNYKQRLFAIVLKLHAFFANVYHAWEKNTNINKSLLFGSVLHA